MEIEQQQVELRGRAEVGHLGGAGGRRATSLCPHLRSRRSSSCAFSGSVVDDEDPEVLHRRDRRAAYVRHPVSFSPSVRNRDEMVTCGAWGANSNCFVATRPTGPATTYVEIDPRPQTMNPNRICPSVAKLRAVLMRTPIPPSRRRIWRSSMPTACSRRGRALPPAADRRLLLPEGGVRRPGPDPARRAGRPGLHARHPRPVPGDLRDLEGRRGALRDRGRGLPGPEPRPAGRRARRQAVGARPRRLLRPAQGRAAQPRARGRGRVGRRPAPRPVARRARHPQAGLGRQARAWKANPLADWSEADVWRYIVEHDVPYNPLHDQGYSSIGCTHCTQPGAGRDGRWAGDRQDRVRHPRA